jgi:serine/threonine-protein kinase HSL1 (negative regulator of Swe1 kinase)
MDSRNGSRVSVNNIRQPLGDVTGNINRASLPSELSIHYNFPATRQQRAVSNQPKEKLTYLRSKQTGLPLPPPGHPQPPPSYPVHRQPARESSTTAPPAAPVNSRIPVAVQHAHVRRDSRDSRASRKSREATDSRRFSLASTHVSSSATSSDGRVKAFIGPWQLGRTLGKGSSARVKEVRHRLTGELAAVKIVPRSAVKIQQAGSMANLEKVDEYLKLDENGVPRMPLALEREVAILKLIQHPNIMRLLDIWENRSEM